MQCVAVIVFQKQQSRINMFTQVQGVEPHQLFKTIFDYISGYSAQIFIQKEIKYFP